MTGDYTWFSEFPFLHLLTQRMFINHTNDSNSSEECWEVWLYSVCECTFPTITKLFHNHSNLITSYSSPAASLQGQPSTHPSTGDSDLLPCLPDSTLGPHQSLSKVSHSKSLLPSSLHGFPSHSQGNADSSRSYVTWILASILTKSISSHSSFCPMHCSHLNSLTFPGIPQTYACLRTFVFAFFVARALWPQISTWFAHWFRWGLCSK